MSEKRLDAKNRWRNVVVAFRMSPEEAQELNVKVSLSGLSKQMCIRDRFWKLYTEDVKNYVKLNTWLTKEHIVETKILPYFKNLKMNEITPGDVRKWQNEMVAFRYENGKSYSQTYKKTMHNILSAIFNHACRFYNLKSNPARQAGNMGREEKKEMLFWTTGEYKKFSCLLYTSRCV